MGTGAVQKIHTRCGKGIPVRKKNDGFETIEDCPEGFRGKTDELLSRCGTCVFADRKIAVIRADTGQPVLPAPTEQRSIAEPISPAAPPVPVIPPLAAPAGDGEKAQSVTVPAEQTVSAPAQALQSVLPALPPLPTMALPPLPAAAPPALVSMPAPPPPAAAIPPAAEDPSICPVCKQAMLLTPAGYACPIQHAALASADPLPDFCNAAADDTIEDAASVAPTPALATTPVAVVALQAPKPVFIDKTELNAVERAAAALPLLEDLVLPGGMTLGTPPATEDAVDVDEVLSKIDGCVGGPSSGGFSSHILADTVCQRRVYLKYVLGYEPIAMPSYFKFGTLMHAVLAMRYLYGEARMWEPCDRVAQAGAPSMAASVKRLLTVQFAKYQKEEYETWCPRAIEHNLIAWLPIKVGKKTVAAPICCRVDMILALKRPHEVHPGPGPVSQGVYLVDHKTSSDITYDLVEGYGSDHQFLVQSAVFELGNHAKDFGPLRGILVSIAQKQRKGAKKEPDFDNFQRVEAPVSKARLQEFIRYELTPTVTDFYNRLDSAELRAEGLPAWPRDVRHCISRWGRCSFYDFCERGNEAVYKIDPKRLIVLSELARPPAGWRAEEATAALDQPLPEAAPTSTPAAPAAPKTDPLDNPALIRFAEALLAGCAAEPYASTFSKDKFFMPGHTPEKVQKQLTEVLKAFYAPSVAAGQKFELGNISYSFQKSGLAWSGLEGKGRLTWKGIAEWVCKRDWFEPSKALAA